MSFSAGYEISQEVSDHGTYFDASGQEHEYQYHDPTIADERSYPWMGKSNVDYASQSSFLFGHDLDEYGNLPPHSGQGTPPHEAYTSLTHDATESPDSEARKQSASSRRPRRKSAAPARARTTTSHAQSHGPIARRSRRLAGRGTKHGQAKVDNGGTGAYNPRKSTFAPLRISEWHIHGGQYPDERPQTRQRRAKAWDWAVHYPPRHQMLYDLGYFGNNPHHTTRAQMVQEMVAGMTDMYLQDGGRHLEYCRNIISKAEKRAYEGLMSEKAKDGTITRAQADLLLTRRNTAMQASQDGDGWDPVGYFKDWPALAWRPA